MKRKQRVFAGLLWIVLQNGFPAQAASYPRSPCPVSTVDSLPMQRTGKEMSEISMRDCCEKVIVDKRRIYSLLAWNYRLILQVNGVYGREDRIFMKVLLVNRSDIDYLIDSLRFVIRSSPQETGEERVTPLYVFGNAKMIKAQSREVCVFVLPKFTLPQKKHLDIELLEKHGGRHLRLRMGKRPLLHTRFA